MILGFTATQRGLTAEQRGQVRLIIATTRPSAVVHGGCVGGDDEIDQVAEELGVDRVVFPSTIVSKRISTEVLRSRNRSRVMIMAPRPPLERNPLIVDASHRMVACPGETQEKTRSGTWATIRYARRRKKIDPEDIIFP